MSKKTIKAWGFVNERGIIVSWFKDHDTGMAIVRNKSAADKRGGFGHAIADEDQYIPVTITYQVPKKGKK